jgi:hypothetical protein
MLIPVRHKLVLTIDRCGPDCLELGSIAQCREQRIGIESRIRTESILDRLTEQPQRNLMSTAECFDLRRVVTGWNVKVGLEKGQWQPFSHISAANHAMAKILKGE